MTTNTQDSKAGWRHGKWSLEEEQYVDLLIDEFKRGTLPLTEGTTLRYFLSKMVNCNPKRVSKKYENTNYNGKHKYEPTSVPMSMEETRRRRERLQEFERRFLTASKRAAEEQDFDEHQLQNCVEESRARTIEAKASAGPDKSTLHHPKTSMDGFQDRLTAEIQSRMELANRYSGSGSSGASLRNMSLSNTANLSLGLPQGLTSPNASLHKTSSLDYISSPRQNPAYASSLAMSGQFAAPELEDPLVWQVRSQNQAAQRYSAAQRFMAESGRYTGQLMNQNTGGSDTSFLSLPGKDDSRLRFQAASSMSKMSQLELATLEQQRSRTASELRQDVLTNDLASRHQQLLRTQGASGLMPNLGTMDSLKRGHEDALDSFRPNKRFR